MVVTIRRAVAVAASLALSAAVSARATQVTLQVDMSTQAGYGRLTPGTDSVGVRGSFDGWSGTHHLADPDQDLVYAAALDLAPGSYAYKHVIVTAEGELIWEHLIPDRVVEVGGEPLVLDAVYFDRDAAWSPADRVVGADLSFVPELLSLGADYRVDGEPANPLDVFVDHGFGLVRLRLWHTPAERWHGLDATVAYATDVRAAGYDLMLDLHYSDTWADPGQQTKPAAWEGLEFPALVDSIYVYTNAVVRRFRDAGALPRYVQIGNEISGGLLWDDGRVGWQGSEWDTPEQWAKLTDLLAAGVAAVRDSLEPTEQPKVAIHVDNGASNALCRWFFDHLEDAGLSYDVIGVSFYPWWHGTLAGLRENLHDLAPRYGKEIMIVETSYPWTLDDFDGTGNFVTDPEQLHAGYPASPEGQLSFLRDIQAIAEAVPGGLGSGPVYWEPAFIAVPGGPPNPHENLTLFDFHGDALPGLGFALPWQSSVPDGEGHGSLPLLSPGGPNSFASDTTFRLAVPDGGAPVAVRVYDVPGRVVRPPSDGHLPGDARAHVVRSTPRQNKVRRRRVTRPFGSGLAYRALHSFRMSRQCWRAGSPGGPSPEPGHAHVEGHSCV